MVERGELAAADGVYELAGRVREPPARAGLEPRPGARARGTARGCSASSTPGRARPRSGRRCATRCGGCATVELREGVWTRPDNLPRGVGAGRAGQVADAQCAWWRRVPTPTRSRSRRRCSSPTRGRARAADARTATSTRRPRRSTRATARRSPTRSWSGAAALAHVRADPLLPAELCERDWPGDDVARGVPRVPVGVLGRGPRSWFRSAVT